MSHAASQIRAWFVGACTGVSGLPNASNGSPRQIAEDVLVCIVRTTIDTVQPADIYLTDEHEITIEVELIAGTFDAVDILSVLAEQAIANKTLFPASSFRLTTRDYVEHRDTDRAYVGLILTYITRYFTARNSVETIT